MHTDADRSDSSVDRRRMTLKDLTRLKNIYIYILKNQVIKKDIKHTGIFSFSVFECKNIKGDAGPLNQDESQPPLMISPIKFTSVDRVDGLKKVVFFLYSACSKLNCREQGNQEE